MVHAPSWITLDVTRKTFRTKRFDFKNKKEAFGGKDEYSTKEEINQNKTKGGMLNNPQ